MRISMKEIWRNLDGPPKNKELWRYVVKYEFSRPKSSSYVTCKCKRIDYDVTTAHSGSDIH